MKQAIFDIFGQSDDFTLPGVQPVAADSANQALLPEQTVTSLSDQQLEEIQSLWNELRSALEAGNWTRYGELLSETG